MNITTYLKIFIAYTLTIVFSTSCNASEDKIAIIAWGSLVNAPRNLEYKGTFRKLDLTFPIELTCLSFEGTSRQKLTRIIDKHWGHPITLWYADSSNKSLSKAIENLAEREETTKDNIFYIKTTMPNKIPPSDDVIILEGDMPLQNNKGELWCINHQGISQLPKKAIIKLARWATDQGYTAVIWTGLGMTKGYDRSQLIELLKKDAKTLKTTKKYISNSPDINELTQFERNILEEDFH